MSDSDIPPIDYDASPVVIRVSCPKCGWSFSEIVDDNTDIGVFCEDCGGKVEWGETGVLVVSDERGFGRQYE